MWSQLTDIVNMVFTQGFHFVQGVTLVIHKLYKKGVVI